MSGTSIAAAAAPASTKAHSRTHQGHVDRRQARKPYVDLFFISFAALFLELACIRWFGSAVLFLTFFTNLVLFACFLGLSVGLLAASRRADLATWIIPLTVAAVALAALTSWAYGHFGNVSIEVGSQASPQQVFFGTELRRGDLSRFVVPIECVAAAFFAVIALLFVGLGQTMGRAFAAAPDRVFAYSVDILGSLTGIACFSLASYCQTSPVVWFAIGIGATSSRASERFQVAVLRTAGPAGAPGHHCDPRRWEVPDLLVALLQSHIPSPKRDDRNQQHRPPGDRRCTKRRPGLLTAPPAESGLRRAAVR